MQGRPANGTIDAAVAVEGGHGAETAAVTAAKALDTELAASQDALRERTRLLATITDNAAEAIFLMDADGRVTFMNPAAERMFGWPREELLGRILHDEVHHHRPDGRPYPITECPLGHVFATGGTLEAHEDLFFRRDGSPIPVACSNAAIVTNGQTTGAVLVVHDITARKTAEARLTALVELGDRLRELQSPAEIAYTAAEIMGRTLGSDRAGYGMLDTVKQTIRIERDWSTDRLPSLTGTFRLEDYGTGFTNLLQRGEVVAVDDLRSDPRTAATAQGLDAIGVRACLHAPALEAGRVSAILYVHSATPRRWTEEEMAFVRGVAERAWAAAERARAERRHDLLLAELNHRVKNILSTVQGLAAQTLKGTGGDPARFAQHFGARLRTLARAHDMLTAHGWEPAPIAATMHNALAPWLQGGRAGQIEIADADHAVPVSPRQAQALVLAFHELATNATKYGALSTPKGQVSIRCQAGPDGSVAVDWTEAGGPPVVRPPDRRGFGTRLLERGLGQDLGPGSTVSLRFEPGGLQAEIRFVPMPVPG
ncbi:PAS domain S-box-containing protein [Belnapia rosea]|uniref:histidine kinase n=1 Tax=Belnapia rosea TaxID=938405 RepID=A0A1G7B7L9_9PROT|nr:PAS domain S-box-containing protein [Belnapia rosea]